MSLHLTPEILRHAYEFLSATDPFRKWNLPDSEDVKFKVTRDPRNYAVCISERKKYTIQISSRNVGHTVTLLAAMAHEIVHVHQDHVGANTRSEHSAAFKKWAAQVCAIHGFDPKSF